MGEAWYCEKCKGVLMGVPRKIDINFK